VPSDSDVTDSFDTRGESSQWPPLTEFMMFKQITIIIQFQFIWFKRLNCVNSEHVLFKFLFFPTDFTTPLTLLPLVAAPVTPVLNPATSLPNGHVGAL
jgi:hypothetical protein